MQEGMDYTLLHIIPLAGSKRRHTIAKNEIDDTPFQQEKVEYLTLNTYLSHGSVSDIADGSRKASLLSICLPSSTE